MVTPDGYTEESRKQLVKDYLARKSAWGPHVDDLPHAIAFAMRMVEEGRQSYAEIYCYHIERGDIMKPSEYSDHLWTLDVDEIETFAQDARATLSQYLED